MVLRFCITNLLEWRKLRWIRLHTAVCTLLQVEVFIQARKVDKKINFLQQQYVLTVLQLFM